MNQTKPVKIRFHFIFCTFHIPLVILQNVTLQMWNYELQYIILISAFYCLYIHECLCLCVCMYMYVFTYEYMYQNNVKQLIVLNRREFTWPMDQNFCYIPNILTDALISLPEVFDIKLWSQHRTSNRTLYLIHRGRLF